MHPLPMHAALISTKVTPRRATPRRCVAVTGRLDRVAAEVHFEQDTGAALARLLALMGCSEQAACLTFDELQSRVSDERVALAAIADDERVHDALIEGLIAALPPVAPPLAALTALRQLHRRMREWSLPQHLAAIVALDSAVCTLFSALLRSRSALATDPVVRGVLWRIRSDESRHVGVARQLARRLSEPRGMRQTAELVRAELGAVLSLAGDDLERLQCDTDALVRLIGSPPRGLLAA